MVTLNGGRVIVSVEPVAGIVPAGTGWTGVPLADWVWAEAAVI